MVETFVTSTKLQSIDGPSGGAGLLHIGGFCFPETTDFTFVHCALIGPSLPL